MGYKIVKCEFSDSELGSLAKLLSDVFKKPDLYTEKYLRWQYLDNPAGKALAYNAVSEGEIVAHYAVIPVTCRLFGDALPGLLSLNTVTHPEHGGKGLFSTLMAATFERAKSEGFKFVFGVANGQSIRGFLKHGKFDNLGPLDAKIGFGSPYDFGAGEEADFCPIWNSDNLKWRMARPEADYISVNGNIISTKLAAGVFQPIISLRLAPEPLSQISLQSGGVNLPRVWLGRLPHSTKHKGLFVSLPNALKASPLHLIFRTLDEELSIPNISSVAIEAIDFDPF